MIQIDMHVHSTYSDGSYEVDALARCAKSRGLSLLALTDHDTTSGLPPFLKACARYGVNGITGIELAADEEYTLHILGYRFRQNESAFEEKLAGIREGRDTRNAAICGKLRSMGIDIAVEEAEAEADGEVVARPHIAALLRKKGYVHSNQEAFDKYIGLNGSAYVERERLSAEMCIEMIRNAGGLPVMAHPLQTRLDDDAFEKLVARLKEAGLWGLEAIYTGHTAEQTFRLMTVAAKYGLFTTAGSDFHGAHSAGVELGMIVSEDFLPWARLGIQI